MVLIKEFRIVCPVTVEEYQVAQLYMVNKISSDETKGNEGVEVLKNEPFENEELGKGQYTEKIYHVSERMPGWLRAITPSSIVLEEKAWNAFPYCRTIITCPAFAKFEIKLETWHLPDRGDSENPHKLDAAALKKREVVLIDIANDKVDPKKYKREEDPNLYRSEKTGRGPFTGDWIRTTNPIMTSYKLVTAKFDYFGLAGTVEKSIQNMERDLFLSSHRQLACWMDEYHGLTMEDIRRLEAELKARNDEKLAAAKSQAHSGAAAHS